MQRDIKKITNQSEKGLENIINQQSTWHKDYKNSAYIIVSNLHREVREADLSRIFSQYGEITDINLNRDKISGKSKGFAFICFEDQRSTNLAIDNFNGIFLIDRNIKVDHVKNYILPLYNQKFTKKELELEEKEQKELFEKKLYKPSGPDGQGWYDKRDYTGVELAYLVEQLNLILEQGKTNSNKIITKDEKVKEHIKKKVFTDKEELWDSVFTKSINAMKGREFINIQEKFAELKAKKESLKRRKIN